MADEKAAGAAPAAKVDDDDTDENAGKPRSKLPLIIAGVFFAVIIIAGVIWWLMTKNEITTNDAYTDGNAISIATNTSGNVTALYVTDNQFVHKGDLLLIVDPRANQARVDQARADVKLARAQLDAAQISLRQEQVRAPAQYEEAQAQRLQALANLNESQRNYDRLHAVNQRATTKLKLDQAKQQLATAKAQVKQALANLTVAALVQPNINAAAQEVAQRKAQLAQAEARLAAARVRLSYNYIHAPEDGWITKRDVQLGAYVQPGMQVFYIVAKQVWITANFKETQLNGMRVGQHVTISVDAFPALKLRGHVQSMQEGSGAEFSAFPPENATGNFVKIVRRVPVKIVIDSGLPPSLPILPLGLSVEPTVHEK